MARVRDVEAVLPVAIEIFLELLRAEWDNMSKLARLLQTANESFLADWAQGNWESVVEAAMASIVGPGQVFLEPYGDGADCNSVGSRVWMPGVSSTHVINCVPRAGLVAWDYLMNAELEFSPDGLPVDRFVTLTRQGWYSEEPPFEYVLAYTEGREVLVRASDVDFSLHEVGFGTG